MKLVERKDINESLWAEWCAQNTDLGPFCQLEYLDAVSENLLFLIDDEKGGIALPYKVRFGVKTLYTPVFCRWINYIGERQLTNDNLTKSISSVLQQADVYSQSEIFNEKHELLIYQTVNEEQYALNTQAKRKIKKASKEPWQIVWNKPANEAIDVIESTLKNKFESLEDSSFPKLRKLATNFANKDQLEVISLLNSDNEIIGSLLLISTETKLLYLKGACEESIKLKGGMYLLMNEAMLFAFRNGKTFDFGGSRIPGVRKFNLSFGGVDQNYFHFQWNKGPFWYSILKTFRRALKKNKV